MDQVKIEPMDRNTEPNTEIKNKKEPSLNSPMLYMCDYYCCYCCYYCDCDCNSC
jgi:hypothetical protein